MPKSTTTPQVQFGDVLRETVNQQEPDATRALQILRELALDAIVHPSLWQGSVERRSELLARDGSMVSVTLHLEVDRLPEKLVTVSGYDRGNTPLIELSVPFIHRNEFDHDYAVTEYNSKPISDQPAVRLRLGAIRRTQPLRFDAADLNHG